MDCSPARYCSLWRRYSVRNGYWDDVDHGPFRDQPPVGAAWQNIVAQPLGQEKWEAASHPSPIDRCNAVGLRLGGKPSRPIHRVQWLHIPKTGSSFGTTLMHRGCPRIPVDAAADDGAPIVRLTEAYPRARRKWCDKDAFLGNLNGHDPLRYPEHRGRTVALFREPRARLRSECAAIQAEFVRAFSSSAVQPPRRRLGHRRLFRKHSKARGRLIRNETSAGEWKSGSVYSNPFLREFLYSHGLSHLAISRLAAIWNASRRIPLDDCVRIEGMHGCQTKMVLGVPCLAPFELNASLFAEAARRIADDFMFVGVTSQWEASVCLFHARLGGFPVPAQFLNSRPKQGHPKALNDTATTVDVQALHDPWDEALFQIAKARFHTDLARAASSSAQDARVSFNGKYIR